MTRYLGTIHRAGLAVLRFRDAVVCTGDRQGGKQRTQDGRSGTKVRHRGSLYRNILEGAATALADRNGIVIYRPPVSGAKILGRVG